jgi:hypothetical protein
VEMHWCERKKESMGSSRMCLRPRRRRGCAGAGAGKPAGGVAARAAAARRGEAGAGQRGPGKRWRGCWGGTWHGLEWHGGGRGVACSRTNLNYTGSSTRVHSRGLQRTSNGIIAWSIG